MTEATLERLRTARRNRRQAAHARSIARGDGATGAAANERLRLYAARLETAARDLERRVVATRPRSGQDNGQNSGKGAGA